MFGLVDRQAGFIDVEHRLVGQDLLQPFFKGFQGLELLLASALQGAFADGIAKEFFAHLADAQAGAQLGIVKVGEQGAEVPPILKGGFDLLGKRGGDAPVATGAVLEFGAMFRAFQLEGWQVE